MLYLCGKILSLSYPVVALGSYFSVLTEAVVSFTIMLTD